MFTVRNQGLFAKRHVHVTSAWSTQHSVDLSAEKQNKKFGADLFIMKNFSHFLLRGFDDINKFCCVVDGHGVPSG